MLSRAAMPITLQSTVGGFSGEFMRRLPKLEEAMLAHGAGAVRIRDFQGPRHAAHRAVPRAVLLRLHGVLRRRAFYGHRAERCAFLEFFLQRCIAEEDDT